MDKKILAVITARRGSKGVPRKNVKMLANKPLVSYTLEVAKKSLMISHLIVSTDDEEIADIARKYDVNVPFMRPAELASDQARHIDVMQHAVGFMEQALNVVFDYVVILQPTSPFRLVEDIDETLKKLVELNADSAVTVTVIEGDHPIKIKKMEGDRVLPYCLPEPEGVRRQDLPIAYKRSGSVYAMKRNLLMKQGVLFGEYVVGHIVPQGRSIDIDTELDWLRAEYLANKILPL